MILLNKPNRLSFSNNIKNFEFFSHTSILFTLECDGKEIIKERHSPGDGGTIDNVSINLTINISDIINEMLSLSIPSSTTPLTLQEKAVKTYTAKWKSAFGDEEYLFRVVKGGINSDVDVENFFKNNFLTKQPQVKEITVDSIEFLNYYTVYGFPKRFTGLDQQTEYFLKIEANTALGFKTKTINTQEGLNCLNVSYTKIKDYFKTDKIYDYKVFIVDRLDERLSTIQSYILVNKKLNEKQYFFENNLGGWDTIRITGECSEESSTDFEKYKINGISGATNTQYIRNFKQHGLIDIKYQEWIDELLSSNQIFSIENYLRQIIINDIDISSEDDLCEYSFNYELCDQNIVSEELKRNSDIPILDYNREDLFFLNKRLSNLPSFNLSNLAIGLALPAENVKGNTGKLEVTTLINHTASLILGQISSLFDGFVDKKGIKVSLEPYALKINYYDKEASDNRFANKEFYYNKEISDKRFALKVNYYDKQTSDSRFPLLTGDNNFTGEQRFVGDIHVTGSIFQHGALKKVVAEHVEVKNEFVHLRQGASTAIGPNMISGFSIENYNGSSKSLLLGGGADGIARVGHEGGDLQAIATRDEAANLANGNGVVWNASKKMLEDAGYRWARKNGDRNQSFISSVLSVVGTAHLDRLRIIDQEINSYATDLYINHRDGDNTADRFKQFFIQDGKRNNIAHFDGKSKLSHFFGGAQIDGSIHSSKYVSGVTGKGWNISPDANAEFTNLSIRDSLVVNTFVNNKINIRNGDLIISDSTKIEVVGISKTDALVTDGVFQVGDKVKCSKKIGITYYLTITATNKSSSHPKFTYISFDKTGDGEIEVGDLLVRWSGNLLYMSSNGKNTPFYDVVVDGETKARFGNIEGIFTSEFGELSGFSIYANNGYFINGHFSGIVNVKGGNIYNKTEIENQNNKIDKSIIEHASNTKNIIASKLGYSNYSQLMHEAVNGNTIIKGGFINTSMIDVSSLFVGKGGIRLDSSATIAWNNITGKEQLNRKIENVENNLNKLSTTGYKYSLTITINGYSDKYYPVIIKGGDQNRMRDIVVKRSYSEMAPDDWNTKTHHGGLNLKLKANFGGWGGATYSWEIVDFTESYTTMFSGCVWTGHYMQFAIFLRGGGAVYHLYSDQPLTRSGKNSEIQIAYSSSELCYDSDTEKYDVYAPAPKISQDLINIKEHWIKSKTTCLTRDGIYTGTLSAQQIVSTGVKVGKDGIQLDPSATISWDNVVDKDIVENMCRDIVDDGISSLDSKLHKGFYDVYDTLNKQTGGKTLISNNKIITELLDVTKIRTNIINASYINGLSLSFKKGKIGGWNISDRQLSSNNMFIDALNGQIYGGGSPNQRGFYFSNNSSGYLAKKNISWDAAGNLTFKGTIDGSVINGSRFVTNTKGERLEIDRNLAGIAGATLAIYNSANQATTWFKPDAAHLPRTYTKDINTWNLSVLGDADIHGDTTAFTATYRHVITDNLEAKLVNGVEMRSGTFTSTTDGNQTVYFGKPFTKKGLLAQVSLGYATGDDMVHRVTCYKDHIVVNRNNGVDGSPQGYYIAFGY